MKEEEKDEDKKEKEKKVKIIIITKTTYCVKKVVEKAQECHQIIGKIVIGT